MLFHTITDEEAQTLLSSESAEFPMDFRNFPVWPLMLSIAKAVRDDKGLPYKADCIRRYLDNYPAPKNTSALDRLWYAASQKLHAEEREAEDAGMKTEGFTPITFENYQTVPTSGRALLAWKSLNSGKPLRCRLVEDEGIAFFLLPRRSRRGYSIWSLATSENRAYYKIL
jgi:hypothetical protein